MFTYLMALHDKNKSYDGLYLGTFIIDMTIIITTGIVLYPASIC